MNERIRELIRLADVHILPDESEYGHTIIGIEQFAELIVRECCQKLENDGMVEVAMELKEHFGVEE